MCGPSEDAARRIDATLSVYSKLLWDATCRRSPLADHMAECERRRWEALSPEEQQQELRKQRRERIKRKLLWPWNWIKDLVLYGVRGRHEWDEYE